MAVFSATFPHALESLLLQYMKSKNFYSVDKLPYSLFSFSNICIYLSTEVPRVLIFEKHYFSVSFPLHCTYELFIKI